MPRADAADHRQDQLDRQLDQWTTEHHLALDALDDGQRWVVFAALQFLAFVGNVTPLRRVVGYFLSHCGLDFTSPVIAAVVGRSERAVRKARPFAPTQFWARLQRPRRGHRTPKLSPADVGPVAKFLAAHPSCAVVELLAFIEETFGVEIDRLTLRRFLKRYGLGCLRKDSVAEAPLLPVEPSTVAPSS